MKLGSYIFTLLLLGALTASTIALASPGYSGLPWYLWLSIAALVMATGFVRLLLDKLETQRELRSAELAPAGAAAALNQNASGSAVVDPDGPSYPHPVINAQTCIGCHACVDACPHDVLAISNGKATPIAVEQCMEDTSCQVECPTVPKSCVVFNTTKKIPARKVPSRDQRFETNVPGIFLIGDVSGVPLIKNAINEGGAVVDFVAEELKASGAATGIDYDVAIIGLGPAGLSAAVTAHQRGLRYVAVDQEQVLATIQQTYQAGKYVYFNPADKPVPGGGLMLDGPGSTKEDMLNSWLETVRSNGVVFHEFESCKKIERTEGGFLVVTEHETGKERREYRVGRIILAIGNRGTPMRLRVHGEDLRVTVTPVAAAEPKFCRKCGIKRVGNNRFCQTCGSQFTARVPEPFDDDRVKFKLSDPSEYCGKKLMIVGAGNSAIEAAVDLAALRTPDGSRITGWRDNEVTLVIRSDFKGDLKLGNKMLIYDCIDEGKVKAFFGMTIKEITPDEVVLMSARERDPRNAKEAARIRNDYVFAMIGGEKPTSFLESLGIKIG
jgi:thioredoxin reductase (NADPH)